MNQQVHSSLRLAVVLLSLVTACSTKDKAPDSTVVPASPSTATRAAAAAPTAFCNPDPTATPHCDGALPTGFISNPSWSVIAQAKKVLVERGHGFRKTDCSGHTCGDDEAQYVTTLVNQHARDIDIDHLPADAAVLVGAIRYQPGAKPDFFYKVGGGLGAGADNREILIVAHARTTAGVASWTMFAKGQGDALTQVKSGHIDSCSTRHPVKDPNDVDSRFYNCGKDALAARTAAATGVSMYDITRTGDCDSLGNCATSRRARLQALSKKAPGGDSAFIKLASVMFDDLTDPYWFTCELGCCTASL